MRAAFMQTLCEKSDLIPNAGVCALHEGEQIAVFYLPDTEHQLYAISNFDPFGQANVLSRGIVGSLNDRIVVASPLLKQHFDLQNGECLEDTEVSVRTYPVKFINDKVCIGE